MTFRVGDRVKLKRSTVRHAIEGVATYPNAEILAFMEDVNGGVVLDRRIGCIRYWNVEDLESAPLEESTRR